MWGRAWWASRRRGHLDLLLGAGSGGRGAEQRTDTPQLPFQQNRWLLH